MKKIFLTATILTLNATLAFAEYDGKMYSLKDDLPSTSSDGFSSVVKFVIGTICAVCIIYSILKDKTHNSTEKGCLTSFFVIMLVLGFICMINQCK